MNEFKKLPKKHLPRGIDLLYEDPDLLVGNKEAGFLTVAALWNKDDTIHAALNRYVRKGNARSTKSVYPVHRLDQATTGILVFAKSEQAQTFIKDNWAQNEKIYFVIVHGQLQEKSGLIESHLEEDEDYHVRSTTVSANAKLARTQYEVLKETDRFSLIKINLLTGRKNQIRVHMSELGHPVVGDPKYTGAGASAGGSAGAGAGAGRSGHGPRPVTGFGPGPRSTPGTATGPNRGSPGRASSAGLALHARSLTLTHPHNGKRLTFHAKVPSFFASLVPFDYQAGET